MRVRWGMKMGNTGQLAFSQTSGEIFLLRAHVLVLAALLAIALIACNGSPSAPAVPDLSDLPKVPELAGVGNRNNTPTPTSTPASTATPTPLAPTPVAPWPTQRPTLSPAPVIPSPIPPDVKPGGEPQLTIAEISTDLPIYSRNEWKHWVDSDKDCQDARAEVLIEESTAPPTFKTDRECRVIGGAWIDPYTGQVFNDAGNLDIDHLVPLKNAHLSGGWQWDEDRKEAYANSMAEDYHLIAVDKRANRAKGARGPEEWKPPDETYHCQYARDWIAVKVAWDLTATAAEWEALEAMLANCSHAAGVGGGATATPAAPTAAPLPTPAPAAVPLAYSLVITEIMPDPSAVRDAEGEWFEVHNPDMERAVDLRGWTIRKDEADGHRISGEVSVPPGGYVVLGRNGAEAENGGIAVGYEYHGFTLTNDGDVIELLDTNGRMVDRVEYDEDLVFPGASTSLDPNFLDAGDNDEQGNWCRATATMPNGDHGTPGERNNPC